MVHLEIVRDGKQLMRQPNLQGKLLDKIEGGCQGEMIKFQRPVQYLRQNRLPHHHRGPWSDLRDQNLRLRLRSVPKPDGRCLQWKNKESLGAAFRVNHCIPLI